MSSTADPTVDVLVPTRDRPESLAVTLAGLAGQSLPVRVVIADQSRRPVADHPLVQAMSRTLAAGGSRVEFHQRWVHRGVAEQRAFLLDRASAGAVLFLDDDVWLRPWAAATMRRALAQLQCGFVGMAVQGLSYLGDHRPEQMRAYEEWSGPVRPERVRPGDASWDRYELHNAANPAHLAEQVGATPEDWRAYKVAWVGGCVMYDRAAIEAVGGFSFWPSLPPRHAGEDVFVQLRVLQEYGGAGILPSGAIHLELATTIADRQHQAYEILDLDRGTEARRAPDARGRVG
jgi:GT2 family glycosyltransferase